jgi:transposase
LSITIYAVDIAKNVMQIHWIEPSTGKIKRKKLSRPKFIEFFASMQPARIAREGCGSAHHWAHTFASLSHDVELLPAKQVKAFVRTTRMMRTTPRRSGRHRCRHTYGESRSRLRSNKLSRLCIGLDPIG